MCLVLVEAGVLMVVVISSPAGKRNETMQGAVTSGLKRPPLVDLQSDREELIFNYFDSGEMGISRCLGPGSSDVSALIQHS